MLEKNDRKHGQGPMPLVLGMVVVLTMICAVGCQKKATQEDCEKMARRMGDKSLEESGHGDPEAGTVGELLDDGIREGYVDTCVFGKWSKEKVECYLSTEGTVKEIEMSCQDLE